MNKNQRRGLLFTLGYIAFAVVMWSIPMLRSCVYDADVKLAYFFNRFITQSTLSQNIWAFLNTRTVDVIHDFVMLAFLIPYIFFWKEKDRKTRGLEILFLIIFTIACNLFWNRFMAQKVFDFGRMSPSGVLPDLLNINHVISWTKIRNFSYASFPGDHGSTIFMFIITIFYLLGYRMGLLALLTSFPFLLPRLVVSGHWFSDIFLGSVPLALFNLGWLFHTPLFKPGINKLTFSKQ